MESLAELIQSETLPRVQAADLARLSNFVREQAGIKLGDEKIHLVQSRLYKRVKELKLERFADYLDLALDPGGTESTRLLDMLTTNKTSFFREPAHFDFTKNKVFHSLLPAMAAGDKIRVWSAACSTGEEPYSLLIKLLSAGVPEDKLAPILATDISETALKKAIRGEYCDNLFSSVPADIKLRYFEQVADPGSHVYRVRRSLRAAIAFRRFNLIKGPFSFHYRFDFIFCRNVLIYFDEPTKKRVVENLIRCLKPGGHLFVGLSESISTHHHGSLSMRAPSVYVKEREL